MAETQADHVEDTVQRMAELHAQHANDLSTLHRRIVMTTQFLSRPSVIGAVILAMVGWMGVNLAAPVLGLRAMDPPPFVWLEMAAAIAALPTALLILATQRREEEMARLRSQLTLQLASLTEQKIAKVIGLLEEQRRENPLLSNRHDAEASDMAKPSDPRRVLDRIIETHEGAKDEAGQADEAGRPTPAREPGR
jgi:uncharacterized membrane protein